MAAESYRNDKMSAEALACCVDMTIPRLGEEYDVVAKVFIPTIEQMEGGFSWFSSDKHRIGKYKDTATRYWTSSPYAVDDPEPWIVDDDGTLQTIPYHWESGVRPCVCVQL